MMAAIRIESFQGMLPKESDRLLPQNASSFAENCRLYSGEIRAFPALSQPVLLENYEAGIESKSIHKISGSTNSGWVSLDDPLAKVIRSPVHNDSKHRYYMTYKPPKGESALYQAYADDMLKPRWLPTVKVSMPVPEVNTTAPVVVPAVVTGDMEVFYTATLINIETGAESQPADPVEVTIERDKTTKVSITVTIPTAGTDIGDYAVVLYRTVVGNVSAVFKRIYAVKFHASDGEVDVTTSTTVTTKDQLPKPVRCPIPTGTATASTLTVVDYPAASKPKLNWTDEYILSQPTLASGNWTNPPETLSGLTTFPNGFLVAFKGRDLHFSVPFRPHAWPDEYKKTLPDPIVAISPMGQSVVVFTTSYTYLFTGVSPDAVRETKLPRIAPCISPRAIVASELGVVYPADDGLMLVNQSGMQMLTEQVLKKFQWQKYSSPDMTAVIDGYRYLAYYSEQEGFYIDLIDPRQWFTEIDVYSNVKSIVQDPETGSPAFLIGDSVFLWDTDYFTSLPYKWKSKEFSLAKPLNLGAAKIEISTGDISIKSPDKPRYLYDKMPLASNMIGGIPVAGYGQALDISVVNPYIVFKVYADGHLVYDKRVTNEQIMRLPSGFKSAVWSFEISGYIPVYSIHLAETAKGLSDA